MESAALIPNLGDPRNFPTTSSALAGFSSNPAPPRENQSNFRQCQICSDQATGRHFGVLACEGCKGFFRRNIQKNARFICFYNNNCDVYGIKKRKCCQKCRMDRCLQAGMNPQQIKKNNPTRKKPRNEKTPQSTTQNPTSVMLNPVPRLTFDPSAGFGSSARHANILLSRNDRNQSTSPSNEIDTSYESTISSPSKRSYSAVSQKTGASSTGTASTRPSVIRKEHNGRIWIIDTETSSEILERVHHASDLGFNRAHRPPASLPPRKCWLSSWNQPQRMADVKTEIRERETADEVTKIVFKNSYETSLACKELCQSCADFSRLDENDQNLLFEKGRYELLFIYSYYQNKMTIKKTAEHSNNMMKQLINSLDKCDIKTWDDVKLIMLLSVLSRDRIGKMNSIRDVKLIKESSNNVVTQIEEQFSEVGDGGLKKSILVMIVMSQLREVNEFWNRCDLDINGVPNEVETN